MDEHNNMSRNEINELITAYIDGECRSEQEETVEKWLESDPELQKRYRSEKRIKELLQENLTYYRAPDHLKRKCMGLIDGSDAAPTKDGADYEFADTTHSEPNPDSESGATVHFLLKNRHKFQYILSAAALILILIGFGYFQTQTTSAPTSSNVTLEETVYEHYTQNDASLIEPTIRTVSRTDMENKLADVYGHKIVIPPIQGAECVGVVYADFLGDMQTPMLEYRDVETSEMIYVFAFNVDSINTERNLQRDKEAVNSCNDEKDYHIKNVNGKHVVSWKWDDTWYTAISDHKGDMLASRVEPLN